MNRLSILGFAAIASAAIAAACTTTNVVEVPVAKPAGEPGAGTGTGDGTGTPTGEDPIKDLAPDWKEKAGKYLDGRSKLWLASPPAVANIKCAMSCHTTWGTSVARSRAALTVPAADTIRTRFESRVTEAKAGTATPFYGKGTEAKVTESHATESVLNATAISFDDLSKGDTISDSGKAALDQMWKLQGADGSWAWLNFGLEPWEIRGDWGVAMVALLVGSMPADTTSGQAAGTTKLKGYITKNLKTMALHDKVAVLWASGSLKELITPTDATSIATALVAKQKTDGGFALPSWGKGEMASATAESDGYATALAVLALCTGTEEGKARPEAIAGLKWLATNQQKDGSWIGQSLNSDTERAVGFMTDAATAYAAMAITTCAPAKPQ